VEQRCYQRKNTSNIIIIIITPSRYLILHLVYSVQMLYQSIHQGYNVNTKLMKGFSVKTTDI
jgi:hypothetical protein